MLAYALLYRPSSCTIHRWISWASTCSQLVLPAQVAGGEPADRRGVALHRPGCLALGGQVQSERADQRLERARVQLPGLLGQARVPPQYGHSFTLRRRVCGRMPTRSKAFPRLSGPARMWLDAHGALAFLRSRRQGRLSGCPLLQGMKTSPRRCGPDSPLACVDRRKRVISKWLFKPIHTCPRTCANPAFRTRLWCRKLGIRVGAKFVWGYRAAWDRAACSRCRCRLSGSTASARLRTALVAGALWQDHGLVFAPAIGAPLDAANVRREFRKITEAVGIGTEWAPRVLRHTFVPWFRGRRACRGDRSSGWAQPHRHHGPCLHELRPVITTGAEAMDRILSMGRRQGRS